MKVIVGDAAGLVKGEEDMPHTMIRIRVSC